MTGKEIERENLCKRIINYCKKHKIKGSFNNRFDEYLVSFEIKESLEVNKTKEVFKKNGKE